AGGAAAAHSRVVEVGDAPSLPDAASSTEAPDARGAACVRSSHLPKAAHARTRPTATRGRPKASNAGAAPTLAAIVSRAPLSFGRVTVDAALDGAPDDHPDARPRPRPGHDANGSRGPPPPQRG